MLGTQGGVFTGSSDVSPLSPPSSGRIILTNTSTHSIIHFLAHNPFTIIAHTSIDVTTTSLGLGWVMRVLRVVLRVEPNPVA